jgi:outer membrane receptor protein involved in Fe transport
LAWQATKWLNVHGHIDYYSSQKSWTTDAIGFALYNSATNHYGEMYKQWMLDPTPENEKLMNQAEMAMYEAYQKVNVTHDFSPRVLFDLGATCKFGKLTISADVKNLFNKSYKQSGLNTGPIPQRGRWFMFDIAYKF